MSDHTSGAGFLLLAFLLLVWGLPDRQSEPVKVVVVSTPIETPKSPTIEAKMAAAGIQCPNCLDIPDGLERIRKTTLLEGPIISTPTKEYLNFLSTLCESRRFSRFGRQECKNQLSELEKARDTNETWMNSIYGHSPFNEDQVRFLQWSGDWVERHIAGFEYNWVGTKKDRYLREQRGA